MSPLKKKGGKIMMSTRNKLIGLCVAAVIVLTVMAVLPPAVCAEPPPPENATYVGTGNGTNIYNRYSDPPGGRLVTAKIFKMNMSGTIYDSYCIDIYTPITANQNVTINGSLSEGDPNINWTAVNYILNTYNYSSAGDKDLEAAAIQAAIWYFTSEPYGEYNDDPNVTYQFMTDNMTGLYDGQVGGSYNPADVRNRSFVIINDTKNESGIFKFPTEIQLNSSQDYVLVDHSVNLTATVYDQNNTVIPNVTVRFNITNGTGTLNPDNGITNGSGQVEVNFTKTGGDNATVVAWIEGRYGTLLRGDVFVIPRQNVSTITIIPRTIEDLIVLPIPELPTVVLMSTGLLALMGYVVYSRRRKEQ